MMQVATAAFGGLVVAALLSATTPYQQANNMRIDADIAATQFINFRSAAVKYMNANPSAAQGVIATSALTPYAAAGTSIPAGYQAFIWRSPGKPSLYVYSTSATSPYMVRRVVERMGNSLMAGAVANTTPARLVSPTDSPAAQAVTNIELPSSLVTLVPGAVMMVGH